MAITNRIYNLIIGKPLQVTTDFFVPYAQNSQPRIINLEDYYSVDDPNAYLFDSHQIKFSAKKSSDQSGTNTCKITLYNLDDDVVNYLEANSSNNIVVILKAGDNEKGLLDIFKGTVKKVEDSFPAQDRITHITVADGAVNVQNAYTVRTYPRNTSKKKILEDLAEDLRLPVGRIEGITGEIQRPMSLVGGTIDILNKQVPSIFSANFSIQNGAVSILPKTARIKKEASYVSADTGLIGQVSAFVDDSKSLAGSPSQTSQAIKFSCHLDGNIIPDSSVYVKDGKYDSAYKVLRVRYEGNYEGNSWYCEVVAIETEEVIG